MIRGWADFCRFTGPMIKLSVYIYICKLDLFLGNRCWIRDRSCQYG